MCIVSSRIKVFVIHVQVRQKTLQIFIIFCSVGVVTIKQNIPTLRSKSAWNYNWCFLLIIDHWNAQSANNPIALVNGGSVFLDVLVHASTSNVPLHPPTRYIRRVTTSIRQLHLYYTYASTSKESLHSSMGVVSRWLLHSTRCILHFLSCKLHPSNIAMPRKQASYDGREGFRNVFLKFP